MAKKKPTKKDIEAVVSNIIREIEFLGRKMYELNVTFGLYLDWKKDKNKFNSFIEEQVKKTKEDLHKEPETEPGENK